MNEKGADWCEKNLPTVVGWLREEAITRGLPFSTTLARVLVRRAITNARKYLSQQTPQPQTT